MEFVAPAVPCVAPALVDGFFAPAVSYVALAPVVDYIAPAVSVSYGIPAPVCEYVALALVENVPPAPAVTSTPVLSGEPCQDELRGSTEVPTVSIHLHEQWHHAERVLRARAARQGYFFRHLKKRDAQLAVELISHGKECEVARGSLVALLLVPVAMREQWSSSKLLTFGEASGRSRGGSAGVGKAVGGGQAWENLERLSVLVNDLKITIGQDLANQMSSILNEVRGDNGDWLGHYDQFKNLLAWKRNISAHFVSSEDDVLRGINQLESWAEAVSAHLQWERVRGFASLDPVMGAMWRLRRGVARRFKVSSQN